MFTSIAIDLWRSRKLKRIAELYDSQALEADVARAAERSTDQFRKSMKAFLYSCLVAAVSAVDEHSKATLDNLTKDNGKSLGEGHEPGNASANLEGPEILQAPDHDPFTH